MLDLFFQLPVLVQGLIKGAAVIAVVFPIAGACSMAERKVCAWIQGRPGPNRAIPPWFAWVPVLGPFLQRLGAFHLLADGLKFLFKEELRPGPGPSGLFHPSPARRDDPGPDDDHGRPVRRLPRPAAGSSRSVLANVDVGLLAVFAVSSLGIYSLILAGWASNSKYPFLGGVRASAQLISYELSLTLAVLPVFLWINAPGTTGLDEPGPRRSSSRASPASGAGPGSSSRCRCRP